MDQQELVESIVKSIYSAIYSVARPAVMIPAGVSNRHVHLCQTDVEVLFGKGAQLHPLRELSQEGFYAAKETVLVAGPKGAIANVRVLGLCAPIQENWGSRFRCGFPAKGQNHSLSPLWAHAVPLLRIWV